MNIFITFIALLISSACSGMCAGLIRVDGPNFFNCLGFGFCALAALANAAVLAHGLGLL